MFCPSSPKWNLWIVLNTSHCEVMCGSNVLSQNTQPTQLGFDCYVTRLEIVLNEAQNEVNSENAFYACRVQTNQITFYCTATFYKNLSNTILLPFAYSSRPLHSVRICVGMYVRLCLLVLIYGIVMVSMMIKDDDDDMYTHAFISDIGIHLGSDHFLQLPRLKAIILCLQQFDNSVRSSWSSKLSLTKLNVQKMLRFELSIEERKLIGKRLNFKVLRSPSQVVAFEQPGRFRTFLIKNS
uniref:Uncharacterized protein n=1 Tax=Glossina pallidipes TaxID=7398 RepID=A0A1B0A5C7_GLOPL